MILLYWITWKDAVVSWTSQPQRSWDQFCTWRYPQCRGSGSGGWIWCDDRSLCRALRSGGLDSSPTGVINNNLYGAITCFNACVKNKARLIFLSTSRVYPIGRIENAQFDELATRFNFAPVQNEPGLSQQGISEMLSLDGPRSFYGTTKLAAELLIREYEAFYGLQAAVTRFGVTMP